MKRITDWAGLRPLWIAGRFITRYPFPDTGVVEPAELGRAVPWYPVIGLGLGLVIALAASVLGPAVLARPTGVAAALVLGLWVWSTGGLHLDGLADMADAWVGGQGSRERTLAIMKDPASGPAGVSALALVLIIKFAGLQALIGAGDAWLLLWVPLLARVQLPLLILTTPYARPQGMAAAPARMAPPVACRLVVALVATATALVLGWFGLLLLAVAMALYWLFRRTLLARLGGFTGDTAGALVELTEVLLILTMALAV
jgi:adenosylcobinamide-GDP ribazoletransferase